MRAEPPPVDLRRALLESERVLVVSHERPDGDAVGSTLALKLALELLGKEVTAAFPHRVPEKYVFLLSGAELPARPEGGFDLAVMLDTGEVERLGDLQEIVKRCPRLVVIDHHATSRPAGELSWVDPTAAAAGILVMRLLDSLELRLDRAIATDLYVAVATDTGFFRFANTDAEALAACARCVEAGADAFEIARMVADQMPLGAKRLTGRALAGLETACGGRAAVAALSPADFRISGARQQHADGVIDELKGLMGVDVCVLLKADSNRAWRVSFRSDTVDVAAVARSFGGGGHHAASGCEMSGSLPQVRQRVIAALAEALGGCDCDA